MLLGLTPMFDVNTIDVATLDLDSQPVATRGKGKLICHISNINGDGHDDLMCQFEDQDVYDPSDTVGMITGQLLYTTPVQWSDAICVTQ